MIDLYCERIGAEYFTEPVNTVSNVVFFLSSWFALRLTKKFNIQNNGLYFLIGLMVMIGMGSIAFHIFATRMSQILDVFPIFLFQLFFLWLYGKKVILLNYWVNLVSLIILSLLIYLSLNYLNYINGSLPYIPAFIFLLVIGFIHYYRNKTSKSLLIKAAMIFFCAIIFRTIDNNVCDNFIIGTHFLWHLLNGYVLYLLYKAIVLNYQSRGQSP